MIKSGGIFPLISILAAAISGALAAGGKAAALGAVGTAAGMALKIAMGKGYRQGGNISQIAPLLMRPELVARGGEKAIKPIFNAALGVISRPRGQIASLQKQASKSGSGYRKKKGRGLRLPGTSASWYPKH